MAKGTYVHKLLEALYKNVRSTDPMLAVRAKAKKLIEEEPDANLSLIATALAIVDRYYLDFHPVADAQYSVVDVERHFEVELVSPGGVHFWLQGYIDLLVRDRVTKHTWAIDHKTVGNSKGFWSQEQVRMDIQLPIYAAAMNEHGIEVYGIMFNFLNTYPYKELGSRPPSDLFHRIQDFKSPMYLSNVLQEVGLAVDEMLDPDKQHRRHMGQQCGFCDFRDVCELSLKGMNPDMLLKGSFERKK